MTALHHFRPDALENAMRLLARAHGFERLEDADEHAPGFGLERALRVWAPSWLEGPPPQNMGPKSRMLQALTYCVFVGVMEADVGFLLVHPEQLHPKSVTVAFLKSGYDGPRAHLAVRGPAGAVLAPFPRIPPALLGGSPHGTFRESRLALHEIIRMVDRANLVAPAAVAMTHDPS